MSNPASNGISPEKVGRLQFGLLQWFEANRRDLPWRRSRDPYQILVSEVMLQQTQVDRVIPYYDRFLERFPTVGSLASAPTAEIIRMWSGLGYNRRAVNLQRTAKAVVSQYNGVFPRDVVELTRLPGVGPYTAGALACFAFEQDVAFLDTNIRRVVHRLFAGPDLPKASINDHELRALALGALPVGNAWSWNQALIEFGALHCTARKPACVVCPLQRDCAAFPAIQTVIASLPQGTRQKQEGPFLGSARYYRGKVLAELRELDGERIGLQQLGIRIRPDFSIDQLDWLEGLVKGLQRDGLANVAEERAAYDASEISVSLP